MPSALTRRRTLLGTVATMMTAGSSTLLLPGDASACHNYVSPYDGTVGCGARNRDRNNPPSNSSQQQSSPPPSQQQSSPPPSSDNTPSGSGDPQVNGNVLRVSNGSQLNQALKNASAGSTIELANGSYSGSFEISRSGTSSRKILITARSRLKAELRSGLTVRGDHVIVQGLRFNGAGVQLRAANCRVTRCYFTGSSTAIGIRGAANAEIDRNEITRWTSRGIHFDPNEDRKTGLKPRIYRNYFHDAAGDNRNNGVIVGDNGSHHRYNVGGLVEYNLFQNMGRAKTISTKSSGSTIRYNTLINCQGITNRFGFKNRYTGNWLERCDAFRITDEDVVVEGNKLVNCKYGILVLAGDERSSDKRLGGYPFSDSCQLIDNDAGRITIGTTYSGFKFPAVNTELRGNRGSVTRGLERNTRIISNDQGRAGRLARKLRPSEVGPWS